jgi:ornithine cyclodeaminase/alanine dehydrogenase-like protein (mu-crystallin family)
MPGYFPRQDLFVVKVAAFVPRGASGQHASVNAVVLAFDGRDGEPVAAIDGAALTRLKCAAVSAHVTDLCAIEQPVKLGIIGCGAQAREQFRAVRAVRSLREVRVYSRTRATADAWVRELSADLTRDIPTFVADNVVQACEGADVIATATTSTEPLFQDGAVVVVPHVHINCMGAHTEHSRELPAGLLRSSTLVVEDRETAVREAGDAHAGALELRHLQDQRVRLRRTRTIFSSTGHISVDACVTAALIEQLVVACPEKHDL